MQELYDKYGPSSANPGLEILAFPCNNFGKQEPGTNSQILEFARGKGASFPVLGKLECENGDATHPFFVFLKQSIPNGLLGQGLKWNFTKFLCNKDGIPVKRFGPIQNPMSFEGDIAALINDEK